MALEAVALVEAVVEDDAVDDKDEEDAAALRRTYTDKRLPAPQISLELPAQADEQSPSAAFRLLIAFAQ